MEESRCRSYITQKKGELSLWEVQAIRQGGMVWGCDLCTDVCPHNKGARWSDIPAFYQNVVPILTRENLAVLKKCKALGFRGKGVLERNLAILTGEYPPQGGKE